ncbi:MAG: DfsB family protein [Spirochaetaceae bacterium]|nr:MAG: DfsB family protein [Spirochaetaceae bacterium]
MPRPTDRNTLLELSEINLNKLLDFIASLPEEYRSMTFENDELNDRDKTVADVICHLHEWHRMMVQWYDVGMAGKKPAIPAEDVTWQTLPVLNRRIYEKYKGTELSHAVTLLRESHGKITALILKHTDEDLFTKKRFSWTGTTSLGAYLISATSSHYDWALKTLRPIKKLPK